MPAMMYKVEVGGKVKREDVAKTGGEIKTLGYNKIQIRTHHKRYISGVGTILILEGFRSTNPLVGVWNRPAFSILDQRGN